MKKFDEAWDPEEGFPRDRFMGSMWLDDHSYDEDYFDEMKAKMEPLLALLISGKPEPEPVIPVAPVLDYRPSFQEFVAV